MPRYFVWVQVAPVRFDGATKHVLAVRMVRAPNPREATAHGILKVRRELLRDLGSEALRESAFSVSELSQPVWYNWRRPHVSFFLETEETHPTGPESSVTGPSLVQGP